MLKQPNKVKKKSGDEIVMSCRTQVMELSVCPNPGGGIV